MTTGNLMVYLNHEVDGELEEFDCYVEWWQVGTYRRETRETPAEYAEVEFECKVDGMDYYPNQAEHTYITEQCMLALEDQIDENSELRGDHDYEVAKQRELDGDL